MNIELPPAPVLPENLVYVPPPSPSEDSLPDPPTPKTIIRRKRRFNFAPITVLAFIVIIVFI